MQKLLTNGAGIVAIVARKGQELEVHIAIDITHDPWSILATRVVEFISMDLAEMDLSITNLDKVLEKLAENHGTIQ